MINKIILPFFIDDKFANKSFTLVNCISFLACRDKSHLILISNFTELYLFKYSKDFVLEKEIPMEAVLNEFRKFNELREYNLSESASGQIIISGPANRALIIDEDGNIDPLSYTHTIANVKSSDKAYLESQQIMAANNLYCNATLLPESNKVIALVDADMGIGVWEGKMRGDFIVKSADFFTNALERRQFHLVANLDKYGTVSYKFDYPNILLKNGKGIKAHQEIDESLTEQLESINLEFFDNVWTSKIYALSEEVLLIPFFERFRRSQTTSSFLLLHTEGKLLGELENIKPQNLKIDKLSEFYFAINHSDKLIYYKAENMLYTFNFNGNCLSKIILDSNLKALAGFQLIGSSNNNSILFFNKKKFDFLQLPFLNPSNMDNRSIIETVLDNYKATKIRKKAASKKIAVDENHIALHKIDFPEIIENIFNYIIEGYDNDIKSAKKPFRKLFYLYKDSLDLLQLSVAQKPSLDLQKIYFSYGLNAISEFCRIGHFPETIQSVKIDQEEAFNVQVESFHSELQYTKALALATIARDEEKQKIIANAPLDYFYLKAKDWNKTTFGICFIKILKEFYLTHTFNYDLFDLAQKDVEKNKHNIGPKSRQLYWIYIDNAYLKALKSFCENKPSEFNDNFKIALKAHQEVWSQKTAPTRGAAPFSRNDDGFLDWECTALAAMAFDKGWTIEISSDYTPSFMIDGTINSN